MNKIVVFARRMLSLAAMLGALASRASGADAQIRLNQAGCVIDGPKQAVLMATGPVEGATFKVVGADGKVAFTGRVDKTAGSWSKTYTNLYLLDFSSVKQPGTWTISVEGPLTAVSPPFRIGTAREIYEPLLRNTLAFFQAQRDGPDVPSTLLRRQPAHLTDKQAGVYRAPDTGSGGLRGGLTKIGEPVDVSGGWFDAGDYLKFVETASYVTALMLTGVRDHGAQLGNGGPADFAAEGRFGLDWLLKMWRDDTRTLYCQVGIGEGNLKITGDHDLWRLPEADDGLAAKPGDADYFIKYRPVFPAGAPGSRISPNLAGRLAAAFALGSQVFRNEDAAYANRLLLAAEHVFELAATTNVGELTTTYPHDFYGEDEWRDDMEWGAAELDLALAGAKASAGLPQTDAASYLRLAAHWARAYLDNAGADSINLYDVGNLAHCELCRALDRAAVPAGLEVNRAELVATLKKRLDVAVRRGKSDPFGLGTRYTGGDLVPNILGLALEAGLYDDLTQSKTYEELARRQVDFVLGANAWGTSFIVGAGTVFPHHLHHQIANLAGSLDGTLPVLLGATVDGPSRSGSRGAGVPDGARDTAARGDKNPFAIFTGKGAQYTDDVSSWANVEPADDYTVPCVLVFARLAEGK